MSLTAFWLALKLLGGRVAALLGALPAWVWYAIAVALAFLFGWHVVAARERQAWNAGYNVAWAHEQRTIAAVRVASAKATRAQIAVNAQPAIQSRHVAETSDVESKAYYERGRRDGLDYAAAHLVRGTGAARGAGSAADLPGQDRAPEKHDGPGDAADMVAVSRADFDTLTGNSLRLAKVHQDAEQLIAAGIATSDQSKGIEP